MASHKLARGTYATTSTFTQDAQTFAKSNGINTMDGTRLLKQIETRTPEQQKQLLDVAFEGEYWRPTCASCGIKLVERTMRLRSFWGCPNFPRCKTQIWQKRVDWGLAFSLTPALGQKLALASDWYQVTKFRVMRM
jgi:restriction system protein